jgi:hypothetical protein
LQQRISEIRGVPWGSFRNLAELESGIWCGNAEGGVKNQAIQRILGAATQALAPSPFALRAKPIVTASERELRDVSRSRTNTRATLLQKKPAEPLSANVKPLR